LETGLGAKYFAEIVFANKSPYDCEEISGDCSVPPSSR